MGDRLKPGPRKPPAGGRLLLWYWKVTFLRCGTSQMPQSPHARRPVAYDEMQLMDGSLCAYGRSPRHAGSHARYVYSLPTMCRSVTKPMKQILITRTTAGVILSPGASSV